MPVERQPAEARPDGSPWQGPGQGPGAAGALPAAARVPGRQDAADLRVLPPGAEPARREPAVPDETVWPGRHRRAQAALGARPAGRARGGGVEGRRPDPARLGLRHAADGDRVPRRRRGRPDPVRPVGVRRLDGRRALHPAPGVCRAPGGSSSSVAGPAWARTSGVAGSDGRAETCTGSSIRGRAVLARNRLESFMILGSSIGRLKVIDNEKAGVWFRRKRNSAFETEF